MELLTYCGEDVRSEQAIAQSLQALLPAELAEYQRTERINDRGLPVDAALAIAATGYGAEERAELNAELAALTDGVITSASQHGRIKEWLRERLGPALFELYFVKTMTRKDEIGMAEEVRKESTDKAARLDFLGSVDAAEVDPVVREVVELVDDANKSSVAKFTRIAARAADNGRVEGAYVTYGAIQSKRYSSTGVQVHNFPRQCPSDLPEVIAAVFEHRLEERHGKVMHVLASLLRPTIRAEPGRVLLWGDWSAVEARGMPWLANANPKLDLYREGIDVYRVTAEDIFGVPREQIDDAQRQIGKAAELSLQFGGARGALKAMARNYGITLPDAKADYVVARWRWANMWAKRFSEALFDAFMCALAGSDSMVEGKVRYRQIEPLVAGTASVACDLPGGTTLYYHEVRGTIVFDLPGGGQKREPVSPHATAWNGYHVNRWATDVVFTKNMPGGFRTERMWPGLLAENCTQAVCAALLRDCLARLPGVFERLRVDAQVIGHTHDEAILDCACEDAAHARELLQREMVRVPKWMPGFPLACEIKTGARYTK
jgi:DNA polymerase